MSLQAKGDAAYEIDARVAPLAGELVLDKNTSSAFHTTPIDPGSAEATQILFGRVWGYVMETDTILN